MRDIDQKMLETIKTNITDISIELVESVIDSAIEEGLLKNTPIVKSIYSLYQTGVSVKDRFFLQKLYKFLIKINEIPLYERVKFLEKNNDNIKGLGEHLIILIDRLDNIDKPIMIANLFRNFMLGFIDNPTFKRLARIIERCYYEDLLFLKENINKDAVSGLSAQELFNNGLVNIASIDGGTFNEVDYDLISDYKINELGILLDKYAFPE